MSEVFGIQTAGRAYHAANREQRNKVSLAYYYANREELIAKMAAYYAAKKAAKRPPES